MHAHHGRGGWLGLQASAGPSAHGHGDAPEAHAAGPDLWDALPRECKQLVLQRLSVKDVARAARTCAELAAHARATMDARKFVDVPAGAHTTLMPPAGSRLN